MGDISMGGYAGGSTNPGVIFGPNTDPGCGDSHSPGFGGADTPGGVMDQPGSIGDVPHPLAGDIPHIPFCGDILHAGGIDHPRGEIPQPVGDIPFPVCGEILHAGDSDSPGVGDFPFPVGDIDQLGITPTGPDVLGDMGMAGFAGDMHMGGYVAGVIETGPGALGDMHAGVILHPGPSDCPPGIGETSGGPGVRGDMHTLVGGDSPVGPGHTDGRKGEGSNIPCVGDSHNTPFAAGDSHTPPVIGDSNNVPFLGEVNTGPGHTGGIDQPGVGGSDQAGGFVGGSEQGQGYAGGSEQSGL